MTIAYLIDPARRTVEPVTYSDIADLQRLLDCSTVGTDGWFDSNHLILVEDNGLFDRPARHFWRLSGRFEPVPHAAVVVGPDRTAADGTETPGDPTIPIETVRRMVEWLSRRGFVEWIAVYGDEAAVTFNGKFIQTWRQVFAEMPPIT